GHRDGEQRRRASPASGPAGLRRLEGRPRELRRGARPRPRRHRYTRHQGAARPGAERVRHGLGSDARDDAKANRALGCFWPARRAHDGAGHPRHPDARRRRACRRSRRDAAAPRARRHDRAPALRSAPSWRSLQMTEVYYDPYDFEIDADPHPVWRRMRDETPLYRNDRPEFWALSRYQDVASGLIDWRTYSSARGTLLELIRNDVQFPAGMMIFEDPPLHDAHRTLMARLFTPRRIAQIEPRVRAYCARSLDPL